MERITMAKKKIIDSGMGIPDEAIMRLASAILPLMRQYFESEEGQAWLKKWEEEHPSKAA